MANTQRMYDIEQYSQKALDALNKMQTTQKPGQVVKGGKADVVMSVKKEIEAMMEKGYTSQQIAEAFKNDVFGILPKTITEIVNGKKTAVKRPRQKKANDTVTNPVNKNGKKKAPAASSTFEVKPDTEDI